MRILTVLLCCAMCAAAETIIITPGSPGVAYAVGYDGKYYVSDNPLTTTHSFAGISGSDFNLVAGGGAGNSGVVLFFHGGFELGYLTSMSVAYTGTISGINLWLDTGGDGQFFAFSGDTLTGLNGDTYAGIQGGGSAFDLSTPFYIFAGPNGAGSVYTLAQLQSGVVPGIDGSTPTALWAGVNAPAYGIATADISALNIPAPEPAELWIAGLALIGIGLLLRKKTKA